MKEQHEFDIISKVPIEKFIFAQETRSKTDSYIHDVAFLFYFENKGTIFIWNSQEFSDKSFEKVQLAHCLQLH